VRYEVNFDHPNEAFEEVFAAPPLKVYRVRFSLPRAWVVEDVRVVDTEQRAKEMILSPELHPGKTAVVEMPLRVQPNPRIEDGVALQQQVRFDQYSPQRLNIHVTTNRNGLLLLSEAYYPGWEARVNGIASPIHRADYLLRGIELTAGEHHVEMVYNPPAFWIGLVVSLVSLAAVASIWLVAARQTYFPRRTNSNAR
jgi:hypothetical protein